MYRADNVNLQRGSLDKRINRTEKSSLIKAAAFERKTFDDVNEYRPEPFLCRHSGRTRMGGKQIGPAVVKCRFHDVEIEEARYGQRRESWSADLCRRCKYRGRGKSGRWRNDRTRGVSIYPLIRNATG